MRLKKLSSYSPRMIAFNATCARSGLRLGGNFPLVSHCSTISRQCQYTSDHNMLTFVDSTLELLNSCLQLGMEGLLFQHQHTSPPNIAHTTHNLNLPLLLRAPTNSRQTPTSKQTFTTFRALPLQRHACALAAGIWWRYDGRFTIFEFGFGI